MRIESRGVLAQELYKSIMAEVVPGLAKASSSNALDGSESTHDNSTHSDAGNEGKLEEAAKIKSITGDENLKEAPKVETISDEHRNGDEKEEAPEMPVSSLDLIRRVSVQSEVSYVDDDLASNINNNKHRYEPKLELIPEGKSQHAWEDQPTAAATVVPRPPHVTLSDRSTSLQSFASAKVHQAGGILMDKLDPDKTNEDAFAGFCFTIFAVLQILLFVACLTLTHYPTIIVTCPVTIATLALLWLFTSKFGYKADRGERLLTIFLMLGTLIGSFGILRVATSSCGHCVYWTTQSMAKVGGGSPSASTAATTSKKRSPGILWDLLLEDSHQGTDSLVGSCRACVADIARWIQEPYDRLFPPQAIDEEEQARKEEQMFNISKVQSSTSILGDLANWYLYHTNATGPLALQRFSTKMVSYLAEGGNLDNAQIDSTIREYLCSPASRIDTPDPNRFLSALKRPRFTGEKPLNISASALQSIMRGDPLKKLGTNICFMLRFALLVPDDADLENKPIKYTQLFPSMNEDGMKSRDFTSGMPFLVNPGWDQDIDTEGTDMTRFTNAMTIYTRLPYEKKLLYFDTKEEYYAFFRWELEGTLQDEFFFPSWYYQTEKAADMANFRAKRTQVLGDHLALKDPYSDKSLGDRVFYAGGQRFLTPMKIPGDEAYEYMYPSGPHSYLSEEHANTNCYRYSRKPSSN